MNKSKEGTLTPISELSDRPERAGKAVLEWVPKGSLERKETTITLPEKGNYNGASYSIAFLKNNEQFIVADGDTPSANIGFGGTDENPFLVNLQPFVLGIYLIEGEESFYQALVPPIIRLFSDVLEEDWKRQGDIFALPLPEDWTSQKLMLDESFSVERSNPIFGTRHFGHGIFFESRGLTLFRGTVIAPDHSPLNLEDGLYALGQTAYLAHPRKAD